jgi:Arabinose efflux permease
MGAALLAPIVPLLMQQFKDIENAIYWVPLLLSIPALCIALGAPVAGILADKVGRRKLLIWSMIIYAFSGMSPILLSDYWPIFISRICVGLCEAVIITCSTTLIGDYFSGDKRDKWLGSQAALATVTAMFLFPLSGFLGSQFGWKGPFLLYGSSLILAILVLLFTWENRFSSRQRSVESDEKKASRGRLPKSHMLTVCAFTLVGGVFFYILMFQLSTALGHFDINDASLSGLLLSITALGVPIGAIAYRYAHKLLGTKSLVFLEFAILAVGFISMSHAENYQWFILAGFFNQFGAGMLLPTMLTWAVSKLEFDVRGLGVGIWQSTFAFGQFVSTLAFSWVATQVGSENYLSTFQIFGAIALLTCFIAALFLRKQMSKKQEQYA